MIDTLPKNVKLFENSSLINWKKNNDIILFVNLKMVQLKLKKLFLLQMVF